MKILLSNAAYIGDLIFASSVLPGIKSAYPEAKIGVLASSWSKAVIEDHSLVDWIHEYDPIGLNRESIPKKQKQEIEKNSFRKALKQIKDIGYDMAIDLTAYSKSVPSSLLYHSQIPLRVGYWATPAPFFFNRLFYGGDYNLNLVDNYRNLFRDLGLDEEHVLKMQPTLHYKNKIDESHLDKRLPKRFLLIHMGTYEKRREWPKESWKKLIKELSALKVPLLFLGKGTRERARIEWVTEEVENCQNLCDDLNFKELMAVTKRADLVIGVESMMGHLASALHVPGLFIYSGLTWVSLWRPFNSIVEVITPKVCDIFAKTPPILEIEPEVVFERVLQKMKKEKLL